MARTLFPKQAPPKSLLVHGSCTQPNCPQLQRDLGWIPGETVPHAKLKVEHCGQPSASAQPVPWSCLVYLCVPGKNVFLGSSRSRCAPGSRQSWELRTTFAMAASSLTNYSLTVSQQSQVSDTVQGQGMGARATGGLQTQLVLN